MLNFLQDINRRIANTNNLFLLTKGVCPACNEHAVFETQGGYECRKCHSEFMTSYYHPENNYKKSNLYK